MILGLIGPYFLILAGNLEPFHHDKRNLASWVNAYIKRLNCKLADRGRVVKASNTRGKGSVYRVEAIR